MTDHMWQINSSFSLFRVEKGNVGLDNKVPRAVLTISVENYSKTSVHALKISSRKVFVIHSFNH